jgi:pSer/pThr/pTyr-binding forkhead associated (FHA) protein
VSRRHVLIIRQPDNTYVVRLFDNTNGGTLNGVDLAVGVERPIKTGDVVRIGTYTLIKVIGIR